VYGLLIGTAKLGSIGVAATSQTNVTLPLSSAL
jgi:hypothetical protein